MGEAWGEEETVSFFQCLNVCLPACACEYACGSYAKVNKRVGETYCKKRERVHACLREAPRAYNCQCVYASSSAATCFRKTSNPCSCGPISQWSFQREVPFRDRACACKPQNHAGAKKHIQPTQPHIKTPQIEWNDFTHRQIDIRWRNWQSNSSFYMAGKSFEEHEMKIDIPMSTCHLTSYQRALFRKKNTLQNHNLFSYISNHNAIFQIIQVCDGGYKWKTSNILHYNYTFFLLDAGLYRVSSK